MSTEAQVDSPEQSGGSHQKAMKGSGRGKKTDNLARQAQLNSVYHKHDFKQKLGDAFREGRAFDHETKASLLSEPFAVCTMPAFIKDELFLERLRDELLDQIFYEKNNDLYKFQQSDDLKKISTPHVKALRRLFCKDLVDWMRDVTGVALAEKVDMTCSKYEYTDTLLCHDDELEGRRFAFILYLVPPWKPDDGGTLDLFDMDEHGQPRHVVKSIAPQWNQFVWFEVTPASHHQVAEVLTDKTRLSVGGWFHGPSVPRPPLYVEPRAPLQPHIFIEEQVVYEWINPIYLAMDIQSQIQEKFETDSEIELQGFLKDDKYQAVLQALRETGIEWERRGPANKRSFEVASDDSIPEVVRQCLAFFQSEAMFLTLSNLTGLRLHSLAASHNNDEDEEEGEEEEEEQEAPAAGEVADGTGTMDSDTGDDVHLSSSESETTGEKTKPKKKRRKLNSDNTSDQPAGSSSATTTDQELIRDVQECNPKCRGAVRRWTHGSYTLVHDTDSEGFEFALDATLFLCCKGWQPDCGGYTSYIAKGDDEELLTVNPAENSLALVYRDKETLNFVKHVNHRIRDLSGGPEFYDISFSYFE